MSTADEAYLQIILDAVRVCTAYKPRFGRRLKGGLSLEQFQDMYQKDVFYNWFGLDHPMIYAAHKAAGGMTSVYRQIGIGCERLFRRALKDLFELSEEDVVWAHQLVLSNGRKRTLHLDGRAPLAKINDQRKRERFYGWMEGAAKILDIDQKIFKSLKGSVFEVRQGYKSKDSKRQNADIANAAAAYTKGYLPCAIILSGQIDDDILLRYRAERWIVLTGNADPTDPLTSTYAFMREVVGYDLAMFFERNSPILRRKLNAILRALLSVEKT